MKKYKYTIAFELPNGEIAEVEKTSTKKYTTPYELIYGENIYINNYNIKEINIYAFSFREDRQVLDLGYDRILDFDYMLELIAWNETEIMEDGDFMGLTRDEAIVKIKPRLEHYMKKHYYSFI